MTSCWNLTQLSSFQIRLKQSLMLKQQCKFVSLSHETKRLERHETRKRISDAPEANLTMRQKEEQDAVQEGQGYSDLNMVITDPVPDLAR